VGPINASAKVKETIPLFITKASCKSSGEG
jgi:hypothetical protein